MSSTELDTLKSKAAKQRNEIARLTMLVETLMEEKKRIAQDCEELRRVIKFLRGE